MDKTTLRPISGFPELLPGEQITFNRTVATIRKGFEKAGAVPVETPAVERVETLLSKGGIDKEVYGLKRLKDNESNDDSDLALHFDLTVPLARYVAQHQHNLAFPFKRYQIQPVWRGERAQAGRYRQFYQCDIDVIGNGSLSLLHDAEMPLIIFDIFQELDIGKFTIRINNRKVITGFLETVGLRDDRIAPALRAVDELEKRGVSHTTDVLLSLGVPSSDIPKVLTFFGGGVEKGEDVFHYLDSISGGPVFEEGVAELHKVIETIGLLGMPTEYFQVDLSVARGLDYYTGTIYETHLVGHRGIGSICSGGRFDDLASHFTNGQKFPGVGISIGLSRLFPRLIKIGALVADKPTTAHVLIVSADNESTEECLKLATDLRMSGLNTEVFLEQKKLGAKMKYANRTGVRFVIIAGSSEFSSGLFVLRNMETGDQKTIGLDRLGRELKTLMSVQS